MDFYEVIRKNIQPWKFIVIKDTEIKKQIAEASRGQLWIADAHVIVCGCALEKIAWGRMGGYMSSFTVDLAIAMDHMILAAANEGLGTCWIGAFNEKEVKNILGVPDDVRVVALTPIGYPAEEPRDRGRKSLNEIVSYDKY
jgi:nitroreductase